jgi:hypothetical protein
LYATLWLFVFLALLTYLLQNIYYGCLYAYTPEVLPSAHRGTGNGIAIGLNRIMGIMSAVIATEADVSVIFLIGPPNTKMYDADGLADIHVRTNLHLCCVVHRHGDCGSCVPIRTVWLSKLVGGCKRGGVVQENEANA